MGRLAADRHAPSSTPVGPAGTGAGWFALRSVSYAARRCGSPSTSQAALSSRIRGSPRHPHGRVADRASARYAARIVAQSADASTWSTRYRSSTTPDPALGGTHGLNGRRPPERTGSFGVAMQPMSVLVERLTNLNLRRSLPPAMSSRQTSESPHGVRSARREEVLDGRDRIGWLPCRTTASGRRRQRAEAPRMGSPDADLLPPRHPARTGIALLPLSCSTATSWIAASRRPDRCTPR